MRSSSGYLGAILLLILFTNTASSAAERIIRAGAAKVDITPGSGVSLDGPISKNGPVTGVNDPLHARAIVFDDGRMRIAIVVCDVCMIDRGVMDEAKTRVAAGIGLPANRILISATHTHAAPRATHVGTEPADQKYHDELVVRIAEAVIRAAKNLAPARVGFGSFSRPDLIRCRRHLCEPDSVAVNPFGESGERIKSVSGRSSAVIEPAGPIDPQFSILSVQHADGSPLAVLGNFSVHYCGGYKRGIVSADYFGQFAQALERASNAGSGHPPFVGIMSNGTSGNTGAIERGGKKYAPYEWLTLAGRMLAEESLSVIEKIEHRSDVSVQMEESELELKVRRPDPARIAWAKKVLADPDGTHPHRWSKVYAQEALHLSAYPPTRRIKLQAIRIGEIGIASAPCEVFAETGLAIKKKSPLSNTFTIELANGYGGYLPPAEQHTLGGYETWPARSSFLEIEAEAKIRTELRRLLNVVSPLNSFRETRAFAAPEAHQGVAVDQHHFYAVTNRSVAKYKKHTGTLVTRWDSTDEVPLRHLNGGVVVDGRLYCAHSNWPTQPTSNSIEMWDTESLTHAGRKSFDEDRLSFTWVDRHDDAWWVVFAAYGDAETVSGTRLVKYDDKWTELATWRFPRDVIDRFVPYSNSGGSFGPDGLLYVTGHDRSEVYALSIPPKGDLLELVRTVPVGIFGQGIAWDRADRGVLFGIRRKTKQVVVSKASYGRMNLE
ncbi:MAG: neutral ceramidase [Porticoccaceae bacterium]|jgi:neutral ceramidase